MNSTKFFVTWMVFYGVLALAGLLGFCTMLLVSALCGWPERSTFYLADLFFLVVFLFAMAQLRWMLRTTQQAVLKQQDSKE